MTSGYASIDSVQQLLPAHEAEVLAEAYGEAASYRPRMPESEAAGLGTALLDVTRVPARFIPDAGEAR